MDPDLQKKSADHRGEALGPSEPKRVQSTIFKTQGFGPNQTWTAVQTHHLCYQVNIKENL